MANENTRKPLSDEHKAAISKSLTGITRVFSEEHKAHLSEALRGENNPMHNKHHSAETKAKMSQKATGRVFDRDVVARRAEKLKGLKRERKVCPHCGKEVAVNIYSQWHGDKCKMKPKT